MSDFRQLGQSLRQASDDWTALDAKYRAVKPRPMPDDNRGAQMLGRVIIGTLLAGVCVVIFTALVWADPVGRTVDTVRRAEAMPVGY